MVKINCDAEKKSVVELILRNPHVQNFGAIFQVVAKLGSFDSKE